MKIQFEWELPKFNLRGLTPHHFILYSCVVALLGMGYAVYRLHTYYPDRFLEIAQGKTLKQKDTDLQGEEFEDEDETGIIDINGDKTRVKRFKTIHASVSSTNTIDKPYSYLIAHLKEHESFIPKKYWDRSQWSIGYGSNATRFKKTTCSQDEAIEMLKTDLIRIRKKAGEDFMSLTQLPANKNHRFLALCDVYYNIGEYTLYTPSGTKRQGKNFDVLRSFFDSGNGTPKDVFNALVEAKKSLSKGVQAGHIKRYKSLVALAFNDKSLINSL